MDRQPVQDTFKNITFGSREFHQLLTYFENDLSEDFGHFCLLIGDAKKAKKQTLKSIAEKSNLEIWSVDTNDIVTQNEADSRQNIDSLLGNFDPEKQLLYLQNGSRLSGVYTAHSLSRVKYATPQEKYFIKQAKEKGGLLIIDIDEPEEAVRTIRRAANSIVNFPPPATGFKKLIWNLKQASLQGSHLKNDRPERFHAHMK